MNDATRTVTVHIPPELPPPGGRDCVVELGETGEWLVAYHDSGAGLWHFPYGSLVLPVPSDKVTQWAYLDEIFAPPIHDTGRPGQLEDGR